MRGHGAKLDRRREALIAALLGTGTIGEAARQVGVSPATVYRWMRDADFIVAYRQARRRALEVAVGRLQALACDAVGALERNLATEAPAAVQLRAADIVLNRRRGADGRSIVLFELRPRHARRAGRAHLPHVVLL